MATQQTMIHPALLDAARAAAARPAMAGEAAAAVGERIFHARADGVALSVSVAGSRGSVTVKQARYRASDDTDSGQVGVLETFCRVIEGLPLQEAADHGTIHACEQLRAGIAQALVAGIHTPRSMGAAFTLCDRLIREIVAQYRGDTGDADTRNFWNPPLSANWRFKTIEQQLDILRPIVEEFRARHGLSEQDMWVSQIEKVRRITVDFGAGFDPTRKPKLLMDLERAVRQATGDRLEFFMEEMGDNNRIRRLGPPPAKAVS